MDALEAYLVELSANRLAGAVPETSGYGPLGTLLNEVGRHLKPKVHCVINPSNRGASIPAPSPPASGPTRSAATR